MQPLRPVMAALGRSNVHAIPGNHDYYCTTIAEIPFGACMGGNLIEQSFPEWTFHLVYPALVRRAIAGGSTDSVDVILFDSNVLLVTEVAKWRPLLDSMERLLKRSAASPHVVYRLLMAHHSPYSIGEHGGWRRWVSSRQEVGYLGCCYQEGQDPLGFMKQLISDQDICTPHYQEYVDSIYAVINRSGSRIHAFFAGHDHSLQLMYRPNDTSAYWPKVWVIAGAGSKRTRVKSPMPPYHFSHPFNNEDEQGRSAGGFSVVSFENGRMHIRFISVHDGEPLDMGDGITVFSVDRYGNLVTRQ
jgi:hypothetical protein